MARRAVETGDRLSIAMVKVEGIDHVALVVRDVERSIRWYADVLGLERLHADVWGDVPAFIGAGTTALALFPVRDGDPKPRPARNAIAMLHLAFRVDAEGFRNAKEELTRRGIAWELQDHQISHSIYFEDPDGHQLEITTYEVSP
jgi:catechol 2,3-dioxygenase-like lactoylglutathione lyase family enzyme